MLGQAPPRDEVLQLLENSCAMHKTSGGQRPALLLLLRCNQNTHTQARRLRMCLFPVLRFRSIVKNSGKSAVRGLDLLYILQLSLHSTAVSTELSITPGHDGSSIGRQKCLRHAAAE